MKGGKKNSEATSWIKAQDVSKKLTSRIVKKTEDDPHSQLAVPLLCCSVLVLAVPPLPAANTHTLRYPSWHSATSSTQEKTMCRFCLLHVWAYVFGLVCARICTGDTQHHLMAVTRCEIHSTQKRGSTGSSTCKISAKVRGEGQKRGGREMPEGHREAKCPEEWPRQPW